VLQGVAGCCRVLQGVAGCCRVVQIEDIFWLCVGVAVQGVAGCCGVLQGGRVLQGGAN